MLTKEEVGPLKKRSRWSCPRRVLAAVLITTQLLLGVPVAAHATDADQSRQKDAPAPPAVKVNRVVPKVAPPPLSPRFSPKPTDLEISRARVFDEPLVPMGGPTTVEENLALATALTSYLGLDQAESVGLLMAFLDAHPKSPWRPALLTSLGVVYRRTGYFSRALEAWDEAWRLSKDETSAGPKALADRALAELAELNARLGRFDVIEGLLAEADRRDMGGSAFEKLRGVRQGLWLMKNRPEEAFRCGPMAVDRILASIRKDYSRDARIMESRSTSRGTSLVEVRDLAQSLDLPMQIARRETGAEPLLPAVVHWKAGHYAALIREQGGRYLVQDPTFGDELWVSRAALDDEASGDFLVPAGALPKGWMRLSDAEGGEVWGKGVTNTDDPQQIKKCDRKAGGGGDCGPACRMAQYSVHAMLVSLNIWDRPVGYSPSRGPAVEFEVTYNQRDSFLPQTFSFSNLGPKWTSDWLSYVIDNPGNPQQSVTVNVRGGGQETYSGYDSATQSFQAHLQSRARIFRVSTSPLVYERRLPDGSVETFGQPDGSNTFPRKVFLTRLTDPQGNSISFNYDQSLRLSSAVDALGQVTTFSYTLPGDPLKITKVTDPFGRFATFEYASGRLVRITDTIGITSAFTYGTGDLITSMTTPYGTTRFSASENGRTRSLEVMDPLGGRERVEFRPEAPGIPFEEAASVVPSAPGFRARTNFMNHRNTFYWDKLAMARHPGDHTKARIIHWLHTLDINMTSGIPESEKMPLENRVWYNYPGQGTGEVGPVTVGTDSLPSAVGRVLDDGTTQISRYEYNSRGMKTREIDPVGRETVYIYGTNNVADQDPATGQGIDLLQVKKKNGAGYDVVSTYVYNTQHQPLSVTDAAGQTTTYTYTPEGQIATTATPPRAGITEERTTTSSYDPVTGTLVSVTGPGAATETYTYDIQGRVKTESDVDGYTISYDYDLLDRPVRTTYPDGTYEETQYDRLDAVRSRDRLGRWTRTFYDALRRVAVTRDPEGRMVTRYWCNCGSLDRVTDANGNSTAWEYDIQGRVTKERRADGSFKTYVYETTTSRLKKSVDAKLQETRYTYALDDKTLSVTYVNAEYPTPNVIFSYIDSATGAPDAHGRLRQILDGTGTTIYTYHPFGQLGAGQVAAVDGPLADDTISYGYDERGRLASRTLNGVTSTWTFDEQDRVRAQVDPLGHFNYAYVGSTERLQSVNYPNGQTTTYSYLPVSQGILLQEIHHKRPNGTTLNKLNYTYDAAGNIQTWAQQIDTNPAQTYTLEYDRADRLVAATLSAATVKRYRYAYDPAGNRIAEQIDNTATLSAYDNMNRLLRQVPGGPLAFRGTLSETAIVTIGGKPSAVSASNEFSGTSSVPPGTSQVTVQATDPSGNVRTNTYEVTQTGSAKDFTYDPNGNLTGDGTRTYEWDAANRLIAVKQGANTLATLSYDASERRATMTAGGVTTTYVYDGDEVLEERSSSGQTKRYVQGSSIDHTLAQVVAGAPSFNVADHLGSVMRTTDSIGAPTLTREYDPWGNLTQGFATRGYAFTGRDWEPDIGLHYYRNRYYSPSLARFLSEDPLGADKAASLYEYTGGNPIGYRDPWGLERQPDGSFMASKSQLKAVLTPPFRYWGRDNECVALVQELTGAPHTSLWRQGEPAFGLPLSKRGTAIATFDKNRRYPRKKGASKNSAVFLATAMDGIYVVDQFPYGPGGQGHPAQPRKIRLGPSTSVSNNALAYSVIICKE